MLWLVAQMVRRAPRRLLLAAVAVAFPVAAIAATLLYVDDSVRTMSRVALEPVQVEMRAVATSLDTDMRQVAQQLSRVPAVARVDLFASSDVILSAPGAQGRVSARLFAVEPSYLEHHPFVHATGDIARGALLNPAVAAAPGFEGATRVIIDLKGDAAPLGLSVAVAGQTDLRDATTWFAIPTGPVQGDVAVLPRAVIIDYSTFSRSVLPALRASLGQATSVTNPGLSELPPASIEAHIAVDHRAYPPDPADAAAWSARMRRVLERQAPGSVIVADNAVEPLTEASVDATDAKILFLLLGIPGALVAAALGLAAAAALTDAHRREDALLRLRGATDAQLLRLTVVHGLLAGGLGTVIGLVVAVTGASVVIGHAAWRDIPAGALTRTLVVAVAAGTITTAARLVPLRGSGRRSAIAVDRRRITGPWTPTWRRAHLDIVALVIGLGILAGNVLSGGLRPALVQGQQLALSFYVLLAPLALWLGGTLLAARAVLAVLARRSRPDRPRPLSSWPATALRWLGRRPARMSVALVLGALAVAFGTEVATFVATYGAAKHTDTRAAFGADLHITPLSGVAQPAPEVGPDIASMTPIRSVPARAGSDRKTIMAIDVESYRATTRVAPQITRGGGLDALGNDPAGVLLSEEIAKDFEVGPGDTLPVTVFPDDRDLSQKLNLHVVGVFRAFPPTDPLSEMVTTTAPLPPPIPPPDLYLARVSPGRHADQVAAAMRQDLESRFSVYMIGERVAVQQRTLTALNLDGLARIETTGAALTAAVGVGVLGAFLVLERRREFALLRTVGAGTREVLTGPLLEGSLAAVGSLVVGIPVGLGLAVIAVRVLGLFFTLPPPVVTVPFAELLALSGLVLLASTIALGIALRKVGRIDVATGLREP
jgi:putative ABC transport system permease protein